MDGLQFTKNVYDVWMLVHFKRICKAIYTLPLGLDFGVSLTSGNSFMCATGDESELAGSQEMATSAPASQNTTGFKKPRLPAKAMLQQENKLQRQDIDGLKEQIKQDREQSKQATNRLKEQIKGLMDLLKEQKGGNK